MRWSHTLLLLVLGCTRSAGWGGVDTGEGDVDLGDVTDNEIPTETDVTDTEDTDSDPPNPFCGSGRLLCDDFDGTTWSDYWIPNIDAGAITRDTDTVWSGTSSLRFSLQSVATNAFAQAFLAQAEVQPANHRRLFVRAHLNVPSLPSEDTPLISYVQDSAPYRSLRLTLGKNGHLLFTRDVAVPSTLDLDVTVPLGTWFCVEWQVDFEAPQQARLWVNDQELTNFNRVMATQPDPPLRYLNIGPMLYYPMAPSTAFTVYVDDVVLNDTRIGCE